MKKFIKPILISVSTVIAIVLLYVSFALLLPYIEVPAKASTEPKTIPIFILSNGVHTDIVVP